MLDAYDFLRALTVVLCVAAATTILFQILRQPVVLGYLLAGLIVGPHVPIPLVADQEIVRVLSELGVILLMFSLGLEFSLRKLARVGPAAGIIAPIETSLMLWLGFTAGRAFGWSVMESLFAGSIVAISSTTIIARAFDEQKVGGRLRELVVGVLIVEDLIAILLMAALTAISKGEGLSAGDVAITVGRLAAFLVGLVVVGLLVVPRTMRTIARRGRPETLIVSSIGLCFGTALLAHAFGYSVALGAFVAGSLVCESGAQDRVERLVHPVRDVFAAVFFVSVGMLIDPRIVVEHWVPIVVLSVLVVVGKIVAVAQGAFFTGNGVRTSVQAGMSMAQIGEFSYILAALGLSLGATREFLYPVAVAVSALTTLTTPWLIRASEPAANLLDRKLPRPLQTFGALYASWFDRLRTRKDDGSATSHARRLARLLLLDALILALLCVAAAVEGGAATDLVVEHLGTERGLARSIVGCAVLLLAAPFAVGIVRVARGLGVELATRALPSTVGRADFAAAPRRALVVSLQIGLVVLVTLPLVALLQPLVPGVPIGLVLVLVIALLAIGFWRSATDLHGHVRAGAEMMVEALVAQSAGKEAASTLERVNELLPGLGDPHPHELATHSPAIGRTLAELRLRGVTGATVLAILRGREGVVIPRADEILRAGDVLVLAGTQASIQAAEALLSGGVAPLPRT